MWLALTIVSIAIHLVCFVYLMSISGQTAILLSLPFRPGQHHVRLKDASHHCAMTGREADPAASIILYSVWRQIQRSK
jgi:hypothetical protein